MIDVGVEIYREVYGYDEVYYGDGIEGYVLEEYEFKYFKENGEESDFYNDDQGWVGYEENGDNYDYYYSDVNSLQGIWKNFNELFKENKRGRINNYWNGRICCYFLYV